MCILTLHSSLIHLPVYLKCSHAEYQLYYFYYDFVKAMFFLFDSNVRLLIHTLHPKIEYGS